MILEDFYEEVLKKNGVLAAEESASASDRLEAKNKYEQVLAEYERRELITWFDDDDVPDWIADGFAAIVAYRLASKFSVPMDKRAQMKFDADMAETVLVGDGQRRLPPRGQVEYE